MAWRAPPLTAPTMALTWWLSSEWSEAPNQRVTLSGVWLMSKKPQLAIWWFNALMKTIIITIETTLNRLSAVAAAIAGNIVCAISHITALNIRMEKNSPKRVSGIRKMRLKKS